MLSQRHQINTELQHPPNPETLPLKEDGAPMIFLCVCAYLSGMLTFLFNAMRIWKEEFNHEGRVRAKSLLSDTNVFISNIHIYAAQ